MSLNKHPVAMVPPDLVKVMMSASKAALADLAWDIAQAAYGEASEEARVAIRSHLEIVLEYRKRQAGPPIHRKSPILDPRFVAPIVPLPKSLKLDISGVPPQLLPPEKE